VALWKRPRKAWWLTDPVIDGRARVARLYVLRRCSAAHLEHTAKQMGVTLTRGTGVEIKDIDLLYGDQLGLAEELGHKGGWKGSEGQRLLGSTELVALFMREVDRTRPPVLTRSAVARHTPSCGACSMGTRRRPRHGGDRSPGAPRLRAHGRVHLH